MLQQLIPNDVFSLLLVFARVGGAMMLLPGFGENYVSPRIRLLFALAITVVLTPVVIDRVPGQPDSLLDVFFLVGGEVLIGVFFGGLARIMVSALHVGGTIIGFQVSLGNATLLDPSTEQQASLLAAFLNVIGVFLIFAADLHHLMLMALVDSYSVFLPGAPPPIADLSETVSRVFSQSFALGVQIAAPFIVVGLVFYIGIGLLARLMPQVQVFFIAMPIQIMLGFLVISLTMSAGMLWFLANYESMFTGFLGRG
jgi:flagellar biosynthesis protein FliR